MKYLKLVMLVVLCSLTVACTAAKQNTATTTASTEWRLKSLEESFLNFREEQRLQADQNAENTEKMNAKIDALETQVVALKEGAMMAAPDDMPSADKGWVTDLKPEDEGWVDGQKPAKPMADSADEQPWDQVPGAPPTIPEPKVVERKPAPKKVAAVKKKPMMANPQAMYDKGYAKYSAGDFEGARGAFDEFLKKFPSSKLVPNALYWKGETYYSQKNYPQAILTFKEVTGRYPQHSKSSAALLKIGMSYDRVGDQDNAIFYLRALVEDFPKSSPASIAHKELSRLGG